MAVGPPEPLETSEKEGSCRHSVPLVAPVLRRAGGHTWPRRDEVCVLLSAAGGLAAPLILDPAVPHRHYS